MKKRTKLSKKIKRREARISQLEDQMHVAYLRAAEQKALIGEWAKMHDGCVEKLHIVRDELREEKRSHDQTGKLVALARANEAAEKGRVAFWRNRYWNEVEANRKEEPIVFGEGINTETISGVVNFYRDDGLSFK